MKYIAPGVPLIVIDVWLFVGAAHGDMIAAWHFYGLAGSTALAAAGSMMAIQMGTRSRAANKSQLNVKGILLDTRAYNPFAATAANFSVGASLILRGLK